MLENDKIGQSATKLLSFVRGEGSTTSKSFIGIDYFNRNGNYLMETSNDYLKYIVYITVNLCNGKMYVGFHKTNPEVWDGYIGCGIYCQAHATKNFPFHKAVRKYGYNNFKRTTIQIFPCTEQGKQDALKFESEIVNSVFLKSKNVYNLALGDNSSIQNTRRVYMFDLKGEYLRSFASCKDAAIFLKLKNVESASKAIRNTCLKRTQSSYGYYWSYKKLFEYNLKTIPVAQYTVKGKFIRHFDSILEAEELLSICTISQAIYKNYLAGGFQWRYFTGDISDIDPLVNSFTRNVVLPIVMIDGDKEIKYNNVSECVKENPGLSASQINRVLKKIIRSHKGYTFKYDVSQDKDIV